MDIESFFQSCFSVGTAAFLLCRMEKELKALRQAIDTLRHCSTCRLSPWNIDVDDGEESRNEIPR